ncbi:L-cystine transport system permease protein TcyB [Ephemeroptericola cinctiostellae]|uniref:L-cystine transport system permease protein TcyB n=1 Tax=Ephemeroptericola cinctiostellae TaxID=2268024 RepID=A0A345D824_9BURK|nr:amino acid ABC transporter permease [Ephemeroptericola cinctiostellae]AXF84512.1 L-cystine transport system permease protein TcyB [Ephemeroptericola cinctiostellae]
MDARLLDILTSSFIPFAIAALKVTIPLALVSFILGLILAFFTALARLSSNKLLQSIAQFYVWIIRGTPLLVQLFIIFYGLPSLGITLNAYVAATIAFSMSVGAYGSETIRAAIESIPKEQWEAGQTLGMTYSQILKRIILPQAARVSTPPLFNAFIGLVKDTSLAASVTVVELFRKAQEVAGVTFEPLWLYTEAALIYLIICTVLSYYQRKTEMYFNRFHA